MWLSFSELREARSEERHNDIVHFVCSATAKEFTDVRGSILEAFEDSYFHSENLFGADTGFHLDCTWLCVCGRVERGILYYSTVYYI